MASSPDLDAQILVLVDAQSAARERLRDRVVELVAAIWAALRGDAWYDEPTVQAAAAQAATLVRQGQVTVADLTQAYLDQVLRVMDVPVPADSVALPAKLRGIDPLQEWNRPAKEYRRAISDGSPPAVAQARAADRVTQLGSTDLDLGMREAVRQRFLASSDKVLGYRRVIHPELSRTGTCGLCIAAADRKYKRGDLLPIHTNCKCEVLPLIKGQADPAQVFNGTSSTQLYQRVTTLSGKAAADALKRTRVQVNEHGELGPVLHDAGHRFRTQAVAAADQRPSDVA